jgi:hypothetical protein
MRNEGDMRGEHELPASPSCRTLMKDVDKLFYDLMLLSCQEPTEQWGTPAAIYRSDNLTCTTAC